MDLFSQIPEAGQDTSRGPAAGRRSAASAAARAVRLDALMHERVRLGILSSLATVDHMTFSELRDTLGVTDGNLSVHARKLEEAGLVQCDKRFAHRKPRSEYRLTTKGRNAFARYLFQLESVIRSVRNR